MSMVRTRFAPSPTGYMHIGNLRTALYEYLIARKLGGKFILRIEDTDQERLVEGAVDIIYNTMKVAGLVHDEGPDIGGDCGPYVQSERRGIYRQYAEELVDKGRAYYCFCSKERLTQVKEEMEARGQVGGYDRHCRHLSKDEVAAKLAAGETWVIRQMMPEDGSTTFSDAVYGDITVENSTLDDQVLLKADGLPTYNFANVVDDHLMAITHVVRGSEYLSSTPKYNQLYQAFGWEIPVYVHLPLIIKPGGQKMSKRNGDASFEDLMAMGYLVDAIINYVALLGWSPGGTRELFTLKELEENFSVEGISKSPAAFDIEKLNFFNGEYIRAMTPEAFAEVAKPWIIKGLTVDLDIVRIARILQQRTVVLKDIPEQLDFLNGLSDYDTQLYIHKKMKTDETNSLESLRLVLPVLEALDTWNEVTLHDTLLGLAAEKGLKNGQILWPVRTALTGKDVTPGGAMDVADILGKEESLKRIRTGIQKLEAKTL